MGEVVLLDKRVLPHSAHQLVARHQVAAVLDQDEQRVEDLRRQRDGLAVTKKSALIRINAKSAELIDVSRDILHLPARPKRNFTETSQFLNYFTAIKTHPDPK